MITKQDLKLKHGDDIIFLFKGDEPFTEAHGAPAGMLIERDDKVLCYECNQWFAKLGGHLKTHNMTVDEYKEKYGFNKSSGLCSKKVSTQLSSKAHSHWKTGKFQILPERMVGLEKGRLKQPRKDKKTIQVKNRHNTCPEQLAMRMRMLIFKFGKDVTLAQAKTCDFGLAGIAQTHGGWNAFKKKYGKMVYGISGKEREMKMAELIYEMRLFVNKHNRLPWYKKKYDTKPLYDFPYSEGDYREYFGSKRKAWVACGIEHISKGWWETIN